MLVSLERLALMAAAARVGGGRVALCHGCFDILHPGHVYHLQLARVGCSRLFVTVSSDAVCSKKGAGRPVFPAPVRAAMLAALRVVDAVALVSGEDAVEPILEIRPDVYAKGWDRAIEPASSRLEAEKSALASYGGEMRFTDAIVGGSSTSLASFFSEQHGPDQG